MKIENIRYDILSKGEEYPEVVLKEGEVVYLNVRLQAVRDTNDDETVFAQVSSDHIEMLGHYVNVRGRAVTDNYDLPCVANYETGKRYPEGTLIGELVLKEAINES